MLNKEIKKIKNEIKCIDQRRNWTLSEACGNSIKMKDLTGREIVESYAIKIGMLHSNRLEGNFTALTMKKTSYVKLLSEIREVMMNSIIKVNFTENDKIQIFDVINNGINKEIKQSKHGVVYVLNNTVSELNKSIDQSSMSKDTNTLMKSMLSYALNVTIVKKLNAQMNKSTRYLKSSESKLKKQQKVEMDKRAKEEALRRVEEFAKENLGSDYHKYIQMSNNSYYKGE